MLINFALNEEVAHGDGTLREDVNPAAQTAEAGRITRDAHSSQTGFLFRVKKRILFLIKFDDLSDAGLHPCFPKHCAHSSSRIITLFVVLFAFLHPPTPHRPQESAGTLSHSTFKSGTN